jgi:hypothetical protein
LQWSSWRWCNKHIVLEQVLQWSSWRWCNKHIVLEQVWQTTKTCRRYYFCNIPTHAHTIYTLKALKFTLNTQKLAPTCFGPILRPSSGGSWTVLCQVTKLRSVDIRSLWNCAVCSIMSLQSVHDKVSYSKEHPTHTETDCNDIRPQTAQFHNERISTDLNLVTWQSTVQEPPEDGLKNGTETCRGKFFSVLMWILVFLKCI